MEDRAGGRDAYLDFSFVAKVKDLYQVIFVPYAFVFVPYVVLGTIAALAAFYFGIDPDELKFRWIPMGALFGLFLLSIFNGLRVLRNWRARGNSQNKAIRILEERTGLHFREGDFVDYCVTMVISPLNTNTQTMNLFLEWHGSLSDLCLESQDGCSVTVSKLKESSGLNIVVDFKRILKKNSIYPFSFILRFDNSNRLIGPFLKKVQPYLPEKMLTQFLKFENNHPTRFVEAIYKAGYVEDAQRETYKVVLGGYHEYSIERPIQGKSYKLAVAAVE